MSLNELKQRNYLFLFLIIIISVVAYAINTRQTRPKINDINGPDFAMIPPYGYTILDTMFNDLLKKEGMNVNGIKWRYKNGSWEKYKIDTENDNQGTWIEDNSSFKFLLDNYFEKNEVISSEGISPAAFHLISGNESILTRYGMEGKNKGTFFRFVNNQWYKKDEKKWEPIADAAEYAQIMEDYFVESSLVTSTLYHEQGYVNGEKVRYRSVPSDKSSKTILGYFKNYKEPEGYGMCSTSYVEPENDKYVGVSPDEVAILKYKDDWALVRIAKNGKIVWMKSDYFVPYGYCGC